MNNIKIIVATHKDAQFPDDEIFLPIQVGKKNAKTKIPIQGDDEGDNISEKNPNYCELTAQYWAWKNLKNIDFIGLCHYRRYFKIENKKLFNRDKYVIPFSELSLVKIDEKKLKKILSKYDIIISKPIIYPYDLHTNYCYAHLYDDYQILKYIIQTKYPEYLESFNHIFSNNNKLSHYNMMIASFSLFADYSVWLFDVLNEVEKKVKISEYPFQKRVFGYMSERLLMVYIHYNKLKTKHLPVYFLDDTLTNNESNLKYLLRNFKNSILFNFSKLGSKQ